MLHAYYRRNEESRSSSEKITELRLSSLRRQHSSLATIQKYIASRYTAALWLVPGPVCERAASARQATVTVTRRTRCRGRPPSGCWTTRQPTSVWPRSRRVCRRPPTRTPVRRYSTRQCLACATSWRTPRQWWPPVRDVCELLRPSIGLPKRKMVRQACLRQAGETS